MGRFVTADNVIDGEYDTQGWNRYAYVKNNPVMYKDPTGNEVLFLGEAQAIPRLPLEGVLEGIRTGAGESIKAGEGIGSAVRPDLANPAMVDAQAKQKVESAELTDAKAKSRTRSDRAPNKFIVIGETQKRVELAAADLRTSAKLFAPGSKVSVETYNPWRIKEYEDKSLSPARRAELDKLSQNLNAAWIKRKVKEGYKVIDIGIGSSRDIELTHRPDEIRSPWCKRELKELDRMKSRGVPVEHLPLSYPNSHELERKKGVQIFK